jgi:lipopolysaccharide export system permease protein
MIKTMVWADRKKRLPVLLYSYLATEILAPFFASFIIMNGVFFLAKLIPFLNLVLELNIGFSDFVRLFSYLFPNMFLYSIPMAAMLGVTIGFSRLSNDKEILAFKASGIGIYHVLPPLIIVAFIISLITGYFSIMLIPSGDKAMQQMMYQLAKEKIDKGIKERTFTEALGDLVVHVDSIDKASGTWNNVWVSDMRGRELPAITMAQSGTMKTNIDDMIVTLILENGNTHMPEYTSAQTVSFDRYVINIPLKPLSRAPNFKSRGTMTMGELLLKADEKGRNTLQGRTYHTEFHKRLVLPVGCLILCLLGMPLGLQAGPGRRAIGIPFGLSLYILYYILFSMSRNMALTGSFSVPLVMWMPNTVFTILALVFIHRSAHEKPLLPGFIHDLFDRFVSWIINLINTVYRKLMPGSKSSTPFGLKLENKTVLPDKKRKLRGNVAERIFHFPECDYYYGKNCSIEFKDVTVALQADFQPCQFCRTMMPDISSDNSPKI